MESMRKGILTTTVAAIMMVGALAPMVDAFHGAWWRARDHGASFPDFGLDHTGHETSTATRVGDPNMILKADIRWDGDDLLLVKFFDADDNLVHENEFISGENINNVVWIQCPAPPNDGDQLETLPTYTARATDDDGAVIFDLSGIMRNSFCGDSGNADDPYYFNDYSDYTATYTAVRGQRPPNPECQGTIGQIKCFLFPPPLYQPLYSDEVPEASEWDLHLHVRLTDHG